MAIAELHVSGYRSIRDLRLPLQRVNVLVGPNGCGKSNLYNSLFLVAKAARGELGRALAQEGGTHTGTYCSALARRHFWR